MKVKQLFSSNTEISSIPDIHAQHLKTCFRSSSFLSARLTLAFNGLTFTKFQLCVCVSLKPVQCWKGCVEKSLSWLFWGFFFAVWFKQTNKQIEHQKRKVMPAQLMLRGKQNTTGSNKSFLITYLILFQNLLWYELHTRVSNSNRVRLSYAAWIDLNNLLKKQKVPFFFKTTKQG